MWNLMHFQAETTLLFPPKRDVNNFKITFFNNKCKNIFSVNDCYDRIKEGPCKFRLVRFAYSPKVKDCIPFEYGGCQSNGNKFLSYETCSETCLQGNIIK